ncbi:MAG: hypothetical protein WBD34_08840 [Burkholderiaceae bacterium]
MSNSRIIGTVVFLLVTGVLPWALVALDSHGSLLSKVIIALTVVAIALLVFDLVVLKSISKSLGKAIHEVSAGRSFSLLRVGYLLFVYIMLMSAVFGLLTVVR